MGWWPFKKKKPRIKASVFSSSPNTTVDWPERNYENYIKETYLKNVIAFRCIDLISKQSSLVKWDVYKTSNDEKIKIQNDPLYKILKRPNIDTSFPIVVYKAIAYLLMSGNLFFKIIKINNTPKEVYVLRPDKITLKENSRGEIVMYIYNKKEEYPRDPITGESEIKHIRLFNPLNENWGTAITEPTAREIDTSNMATEWNMKILQNEARMGMIYLFKGSFSTEQFDQVERKIKEFSGSENAGKSLILDSENGEIDVKPYNWSPKEIDFLEGGREVARKICFGYGVDPRLIGIPGDSTYSNFREARLSLWEDTVLFYLDYIKNELNHWFYGAESTIEIDYSTDSVPAMEYKREMLFERADKANFLTINEKRRMAGLEDIEGGDVLLVPANLLPLESAIDMSENNQEQIDDTKNKIGNIVDEEAADELTENMID